MEGIKQNKMGYEPVTRLLLKMAPPAMLSMLIQALYNIVDSIYIAKISKAAFSAISIAYPIQILMIAICVGTGVGVNSLVARKLGEGQKEEANSAAIHGLILALISWIAIAILAALFARTFFAGTTSNIEVIELGVQYISIVTLFGFGSFIQVVSEKTIQSTGNMIFPMCSQLLGCIINIILDPILIFGYFGFPALGMRGAAIATVVGQIIGMIFCLIVLFKMRLEIKISFKGFRWHGETVKNIYRVGFPAIIMQAITSVLVTLLNKILINFSETAVNVLGIYFKLQSFVFMPIFGLTQGAMPILGFNFGAGNRKRLTDTLKVGVISVMIIMAFGVLAFMAIPQVFLGFFDADAETIAIGSRALRTLSLCFIPAAFSIMLSTLFQAVGMGQRSLVLSLVRQLICILPVSFILSKISLDALWFAFPISEVVSSVVAILYFNNLRTKVLPTLSNQS